MINMLLIRKQSSKLAINGGSPVRCRPMPKWPQFDQDEISAAIAVLQSGAVNYWTGEQVRNFESEFSRYIGTCHGIALANGTAALELALKSLGVGSGDEVLVTCRSFIASAACAVLCGATPVFCDVDENSQNITAETLRPHISAKTKAIIAVHLAGWPCEMDQIMNLADEHGLWVIEDCAQALGATYKGRRVGSIGHIGTFSFCQDKILTTAGEGGMLTTNNAVIWEKAWSFKDHGKNFFRAHKKNECCGFQWLHDSIGTNLRLTEVQAAIGRIQLTKLNSWLLKRQALASLLNNTFSKIPPLRVTLPPNGIGHAYYKYYTFIKPEALPSEWTRDKILTAINAEGIPCMTGACPEIYLENAFSSLRKDSPNRKEIASRLGETSLMFLVHPTLNESDIMDVCAAVDKVFSEISAL